MQVQGFLKAVTPQSWLEFATKHVDLLLLDHAHCEKKAAQAAIQYLLRYPEFDDLVYRASRFAREELRHFEQVYQRMQQRGIALKYLTPSRYAKGLLQHRNKEEPYHLAECLLISALIEARSCERFAAVVPYVDDQLAQFYQGLYAAEERHFLTYLELAYQVAPAGFDQRVEFFKQKEAELILHPDDQFRFHSGVPSQNLVEGMTLPSI